MMGVSGSGKTTVGLCLAEALGWEFQDADDFHTPEHRDKMAHGFPLTDEDREPWLETVRDAMLTWVADGRQVVFACSALKADFRKRLLEGMEEFVQFIHLQADFDLIDSRLARRRGHFMPRTLLASQFEILEAPADAIVVDASDSPDRIVACIRSRLHL